MEKRSCREPESLYDRTRIGRMYFRWIGGIMSLFVLSMLCLSCKQTGAKEVESVRLHHSLVVDDESLLLGKVFDLAWESDSVLVIVDSGNEGFLHAVHVPDGRVMYAYGKIGQGPDEYLYVGTVHPAGAHHLIMLDVNKRECFEQEGAGYRLAFKPLFHLKDSVFHYELLPVADNRYIAIGLYEDNRFFLLDEKGNRIEGFGDYPYRDEKEKQVSGIIRGEIYQGRLASNSRGTRFVQAVLKSRIMVFYEKGEEGWKCIKENLESFPTYNYNSPAMDAEDPLGYLDVCATDSYVYALYSGKNYRDDRDAAFLGQTVEVYRWDGTPVKRLTSEVPLRNIEVTKDDSCLYAVAYAPEPVLIRMNLPVIQ